MKQSAERVPADPKLFRFKIVNPRWPEDLESQRAARAAYALWRQVWHETFTEVKASPQAFHSDDFLRQSEVACVFYGETAVGLVLHDWFHLDMPAHREHSYLARYPQATRKRLLEITGKPLMFMSYLTVHPAWRKGKLEVPLSEALIGLSVKRFLASPAEALVSFTRNDRGIHELVRRYGARCLEKGLMHGIPSDFISIHRSEARSSELPGAAEFVEALWGRLEESSRIPTPMPHVSDINHDPAVETLALQT